MKKVTFIGIVFSAVLVGGCSSPRLEDSAKPNIVFIVADDLGWADLGCYGADLHETPCLDKLAEKSLIFTSSYSAAPVCSPTRASILTGKYPARLNFTIWSEAASVSERKNQEIYPFLPPQTIENLPLEEVTLAEKLKEAGYLTAHVGKWHIGDLMHFPETQGFDIGFAASQRGAPPTYFYPYRGEAFGEFRFVTDMDADANGHYFTERKGEYLTDRLTDEAIKIMKDAGSRPFYLNLCFYNVHTPLEAKEEDVNYFKQKLNSDFHHQNETYAAMVKSLDTNVGRLLDKLEELKIVNNTIVIFISDNGGYINGYKGKKVTDNFPLRSGKGSLYEGGIRIPTIIYYPEKPGEGRKNDTPICTTDFLPTLLELTGQPVPGSVDGKSFLPLLKDVQDTSFLHRTLFWHYPHYYPTTTPVSAIRDGNWKLLEYLEDGSIELYDLSVDLGEIKNLAYENQEKAKQLLEKLHDWKVSVRAQGIVPNPDYKIDKVN